MNTYPWFWLVKEMLYHKTLAIHECCEVRDGVWAITYGRYGMTHVMHIHLCDNKTPLEVQETVNKHISTFKFHLKELYEAL